MNPREHPLLFLCVAISLLVIALTLTGCGNSDSAPATMPNNPVPAPGDEFFHGDSHFYRWSGQGVGTYVDPTIYQRLSNAIDTGIPGNTTCAMLARFQEDVLQYKPGTVDLMGGANDLLAGLSDTGCLQQMVDEALDDQVRVILWTIPPSPILDPAAVANWNTAVRVMAKADGVTLADAGAATYLPSYWEEDDEHLNNVGYQNVLWPIRGALGP